MDTTASSEPTRIQVNVYDLEAINAGGRIRLRQRMSPDEEKTLFGRRLANTGKYMNPHVISSGGYTGIVAKFADGNIAIFASLSSDRTIAVTAEFAEADTMPYKQLLKANAGRDSLALKIWPIDDKLHVIVGTYAARRFTKVELCVPMSASSEAMTTRIALVVLERYMTAVAAKSHTENSLLSILSRGAH